MKLIPVRGALESDAFEYKKYFNWKAGLRKRVKRAYNRRVRKVGKREGKYDNLS